MHEYRKVSLDYLDTAPHRLQFEQDLPVNSDALFRLFEQTDTWGWAGIDTVVWNSEPPFNAHTTRTIFQPNGNRIDEQFLLWEQNQRMVFRLERGDIWMLGALIEDYTVVSTGHGHCRLTWTIGFEFRGLLKLLGPILAPAVRKQFQMMFSQLRASLPEQET